MKKVLLLVVVCVLAGIPAEAEVGDEFRGWIDGPAGFLLTEAENQAWSQVTDDQSAGEFIALFWAKRDPNLATRENEFRMEFEIRVAAADAEFGEGDTRGAMTPRGKTLIILGPPKEHGLSNIGTYLAGLYRTGRAPDQNSADIEAHVQMQGVTFNLSKGMADIWGYGPEQLPVGVEWPSKDDVITFGFFDHEGEGQYRMQLGIRKSADAAEVLRAAPAALVVHPNLDAIPVFGLIPGIPAASPEELAWLDEPKAFEGVVADFGLGAAGPDFNVGWLSVRFPADAPLATALIGRLTLEGKIVGSFRMTVSGQLGPLGVVYEAAIPSPDGDVVLDVALADSEGALHIDQFESTFVGGAGAFMTPVYAGAAVTQGSDAAAGEPFIFGGYHLAVRPDGRYIKGENLALFCMLVLPEADSAVRAGTVRMRWYVDGKATPNQPSQSVQFGPAGVSTWVWGTQLQLEALSPDNQYELKVTVKDTESEVSVTTRLPISFVAQ